MKKYLLLILPLCLLLAGCAPSRREAVQAYYKSIQTAQMEAQVVVHLLSDDRTFSVTAAYDREKGATTTIVEPELLRGLSATVSAEEMQLLYDGSVWPAGDGGDLSAANCLPMLLYAAGEGFVTREGSDRIGGQYPVGAAGDLGTLCIRAEPGRKSAADRDVYAVYLPDGELKPLMAPGGVCPLQAAKCGAGRDKPL